MTYTTTTALNVKNGDHVLIDSEYRAVHSVHYSGPVDGTGTVTLCFANRESVVGADQPIRVLAERSAVIVGNGITPERVAAYLPRGYRVVESDVAGRDGDSVIITGHDSCGWTMDDYVLPRLASGGMFGLEIVDVDRPTEFVRTDSGAHLMDGLGADD